MGQPVVHSDLVGRIRRTQFPLVQKRKDLEIKMTLIVCTVSILNCTTYYGLIILLFISSYSPRTTFNSSSI